MEKLLIESDGSDGYISPIRMLFDYPKGVKLVNITEIVGAVHVFINKEVAHISEVLVTYQHGKEFDEGSLDTVHVVLSCIYQGQTSPSTEIYFKFTRIKRWSQHASPKYILQLMTDI